MTLTMSRTMTRIDQIWKEIKNQSGGAGLFRRVDETHPLDLYAGIDYHGKQVLMLVAHEAPTTLPPPGIVEVTCNQRGDNEFAIVLQLLRQEFEELFGRLCQDLVDATRVAAPDHGGEELLRRLGRWRKLLEAGPRTTLSDVALRGLVGELWILKSLVIPRLGVDAGVKGWAGPLGAPQDFVIGERVLEVKTCAVGTQQVTITSLQQLDAGKAPLFLGVVWLAPASPTSQRGFSVANLVASVRIVVETSPLAGTEFALRLAEAGYADCEEYERGWYSVEHVRYFHVRDDFPRLRREGTPTGVTGVSYSLDLGACNAYECQF